MTKCSFAATYNYITSWVFKILNWESGVVSSWEGYSIVVYNWFANGNTILVYYRNSVKRASVNVLPENVFNRVPAELPEGQCSAVTRLKYVLWSLVYDASAYRIAVLCFSYQKRPDLLFQKHPVNNADNHSTLYSKFQVFITNHSHIKRGLKPQQLQQTYTDWI